MSLQLIANLILLLAWPILTSLRWLSLVSFGCALPIWSLLPCCAARIVDCCRTRLRDGLGATTRVESSRVERTVRQKHKDNQTGLQADTGQHTMTTHGTRVVLVAPSAWCDSDGDSHSPQRRRRLNDPTTPRPDANNNNRKNTIAHTTGVSFIILLLLLLLLLSLPPLVLSSRVGSIVFPSSFHSSPSASAASSPTHTVTVTDTQNDPFGAVINEEGDLWPTPSQAYDTYTITTDDQMRRQEEIWSYATTGAMEPGGQPHSGGQHNKAPRDRRWQTDHHKRMMTYSHRVISFFALRFFSFRSLRCRVYRFVM